MHIAKRFNDRVDLLTTLGDLRLKLLLARTAFWGVCIQLLFGIEATVQSIECLKSIH